MIERGCGRNQDQPERYGDDEGKSNRGGIEYGEEDLTLRVWTCHPWNAEGRRHSGPEAGNVRRPLQRPAKRRQEMLYSPRLRVR